MKPLSTFLWFVFTILISQTLSAVKPPDQPDPSPPPVEEIRHLIQVPRLGQQESEDYKIEILVGKMMPTDGVNRTSLEGTFKDASRGGSSGTSFRFITSGNAFSTLIGSLDGNHPQDRWVQSAPLLLPYNSQVPVVIYTPAGYDVRYRIWKASDSWTTAKPLAHSAPIEKESPVVNSSAHGNE